MNLRISAYIRIQSIDIYDTLLVSLSLSLYLSVCRPLFSHTCSSLLSRASNSALSVSLSLFIWRTSSR